MSSERLERIDTHMHKAVADGMMVGGMGMIARNGKVVYTQTWGDSDREANKEMTEDTIFRIYSMSKPITAVALMMLYEEGKFFLNDPVAKYLPEMANLQLAVSTADGDTGVVSDGTSSTGVGAGDDSKIGETRAPKRQPTIRDLMRHTAGLTYGIFGNTEVDKMYREAGLLGEGTIEDFVAKLGQIPLQYEPGTRWHYSVGVDVQGRLVEVLSGMSFGEFLKQRIFDPLEMEDTSFIVPDQKWDRFAKLYAPKGTAAGLNKVWQTNTSTALEPAADAVSQGYREGSTFESGGGGLASTAEDYMRFSLMLLNGGELNGARLLSPKTIELMSTNHLGDMGMGWGRTGWGFGLGFGVQLNPGDSGETGSAGEYNWGGAAGTRFWIDPQEQLIGLFMVQSLPHQTRLADQFKVLTYQAITELE
jgi:CubicO group peptidase (beta-lactamase class C family)